MKKPMIRIHNSQTNEIIDREMNDDEFAQHQKDVKEYEAQKAQAEAKAATKSALLERMGLTEDEAKLLLG